MHYINKLQEGDLGKGETRPYQADLDVLYKRKGIIASIMTTFLVSCGVALYIHGEEEKQMNPEKEHNHHGKPVINGKSTYQFLPDMGGEHYKLGENIVKRETSE